MPVLNTVFMSIILFFLAMILFANNPFAINPTPATEGQGLNPLLQNIAMVFHPPSLYLGYTGMSVPFAFMIAALVTRRIDASWIEDSRRWTLIAWFFLTLGNILGAAWAYVELGWGGFWAWDPVENAALMPWLTASAFIHSVMIQKKRGMLLTWNVTLIFLTFLLTILGTYLTRSGIVQSVHAFSDSKLGPYFLIFMLIIVLVSLYLIISRREELRSANVLQSYWSKESAFLANNIILVVGAVSVLWGTLFPTLSEWILGKRITVGPPFFNKIMAPIGLLLLLLMGIGPMISWKKATPRNLKINLAGPFFVGLLAALISFIWGMRQWYAIGTVGLILFVLTTIFFEFYRGVKVVRLQKKMPFFSALIDLIRFNNRRYGGYLVHVGILMVFTTIAGTVFKLESDFSLKPSQSYTFGGYRYIYQKPEIEDSEHKSSVMALVDLYRGDKRICTLRPAKFFYKTSQQPTTEVDIYHAPLADVYLIIGNIDTTTGDAEFRVTINPVMSFIWLGGIVILMGTIIVLLPRGWRVAVVGLLAGSLLLSHPIQAAQPPPGFVHQEEGPPPFAPGDSGDPQIEQEKKLSEKLNCMCGGCVRQSLKTCTCSFAKDDREAILNRIRKGESDDQITQDFIGNYGLAVLVEPPHTGFFNVGYWFPPFILFFSIIFGAVLARRWRGRVVASSNKNISSTAVTDPVVKNLQEELRHFDDH